MYALNRGFSIMHKNEFLSCNYLLRIYAKTDKPRTFIMYLIDIRYS